MIVYTYTKQTKAVQFDGTSLCAQRIAAWFGLTYYWYDSTLQLQLPVGHVTVPIDHYVIKNMLGEPHVIETELFEQTYAQTKDPGEALPAASTMPQPRKEPKYPLHHARELTAHCVAGKGSGQDDTRILVLDEPGQGGACHKYLVVDGNGVVLGEVQFQDGPIQEVGCNGVQQEHLLAIVCDRLTCFQAGAFANGYNQLALEKCDEALESLKSRTHNRIQRGVEGFNKA